MINGNCIAISRSRKKAVRTAYSHFIERSFGLWLMYINQWGYSLFFYSKVLLFGFIYNTFLWSEFPKASFIVWSYLFIVIGHASITINHNTLLDFKILSLLLTFLILFLFLSGDVMKKVFHYLFLIFWFLIQEDIAILLLHQVQQTKEIVIFFAQFFFDVVNAFICVRIKTL